MNASVSSANSSALKSTPSSKYKMLMTLILTLVPIFNEALCSVKVNENIKIAWKKERVKIELGNNYCI